MKSIYYEIFESLRDRIEGGEFPYQSFIPSEAVLTEEYECSHNTLRKALSLLRMHGYVQPIQGKGVIVIWQPSRRADFVLGDIETFKEAAERNGMSTSTKVRSFELIIADAEIAATMGFAKGDELYRIERVRFLNDQALIYDINYLLASVAKGLTPQIVEDSVYAYLENELGVHIATSKRTIRMEHATSADRMMLDLLDFSMVAVVHGRTFSSDGILFEVTTSRHRPDFFTFHDTAIRGY